MQRRNTIRQFSSASVLGLLGIGICIQGVSGRRAYNNDLESTTGHGLLLTGNASLLDVAQHAHTDCGNNPLQNLFNWIEAQVGNDFQKRAKATQMTGVKENSNEDLAATAKAVQFTVTMVLACLAVFTYLLHKVPAVYAHRALEDFAGEDGKMLLMPEITLRTPFNWASRTSDVDDDEAMKLIGLDALMLTKFLLLCQRVLLIICPTICIVLVPMHYFMGSVHMLSSEGNIVKLDAFTRFGISTVTSTWDIHAVKPEFVADYEITNRALCWVHAAMVFFVCGVTIQQINVFQRDFLTLRWKWLKSMAPPRSTTLLVEGIPDAQRSDQSLYAYFAKLFSEKAVHRCYVIRRTWALRRCLARVEHLEGVLRDAEAAWEESGRAEDAHPTRLTSYVEASSLLLSGARGHGVIEAIEQQLAAAREKVREERQKMSDVETKIDKVSASTSGFVTFTSKRWCRLASREQLKANPAKMVLSQVPAPNDVRYDDLATDLSAQTGSVFMEILLTCCVFVFWVPLTGLIASFTSLSDLKTYRALHFLNDLPLSFQHILEGVLAQLALKIVLALLPMMLMMIINFNFLKSGNQAQLRMQSRYFMFLVVFVVLVSALSQTLLHTLKELISDPTQITKLLSKLPDSAHFYINYIVMGVFTLAMAMIRISPLAKYLIWKGMNKSSVEAREKAEPEDQDGDGMGARMAKVSHFMTITLVFCHASPSITLAGLLWFAFAGYVYKWLVLYSETKKADLGGAFYDAAIKHLYFSLFLYILIMIAVLLNAPWGPGWPTAAVMSCGILVYSSYDHYCHIIWEQMPFETVVEQDAIRKAESAASLLPEDDDWSYHQPECAVPAGEVRASEEGKRSDGFA